MDLKNLDNLKIGDYSIKLERYEQGRFKEEFNFVFSLFYKGRKVSEMFLHGKIFFGRKPHYRPWIEVAYDENVERHVVIDFLKALLSIMPEGSSAMVDYDFETYKLLLREPPENTWIGKLMKECGYGNFRNWYIPEGYKEGGPKLQGWK